MEAVLSELLTNFEDLLTKLVTMCEKIGVKKIDRCEVVGGNSNWQLFKNKLLEFFKGKENMISLLFFYYYYCFCCCCCCCCLDAFIPPAAHQ